MFPRAKKSYGQHFLADPSAVGKIVAAASLAPGETVLEIGPGTGVLTHGLVEAGAKVVAVEADTDLVPALRETFGERIDLVEGDILGLRRQDSTLGGRLQDGTYALVANIPYNITSALVEDFLRRAPRPSRMVLMVQKEVAERMAASPPRMGLLSVVCQTYADVKKVLNVPAGSFRPAPKVDSAVVLLRLHDPSGHASAANDPEAVIALAKAGFSRPRKQLHGNLAAAGYGTSEEIKAALEKMSLRPDARAETLSATQWADLRGHARGR